MIRSRCALVPLMAMCLALLAPACATREVPESAYDRDGIEIILRSYRKGSSTIRRNFQHPVRISEQRLANILGAIDVRGREDQLAGIRSAFEPAKLGVLATALSTTLAKANSDQELAVRMVTKVKQHGIFDRKYLSTFVAYVENDLLWLHLSRIDWKDPEREKKTTPPVPRIGVHPMKFVVVPSEGMYTEGPYAVSVEWRDPIFERPLHSQAADGRRERTILLEDHELRSESRRPRPDDALSNLTPEQLRELADLEDSRQAGRVTEGNYRRLRKEILDRAGAADAASD